MGRGDGAGNDRNQQNDYRGEKENGGCGAPHVRKAAGVAGHQNQAQIGGQVGGELGLDGQTGNVPVGSVQAAQIGHAGVAPLLQDLTDHRLWNALVVHVLVCGVEDVSLGVGHNHGGL